MSIVSPKHALDEQELDFCRMIAAGQAATESYKRAFYRRRVDKHGKWGEPPDMPSIKTIGKQAQSLLRRDYVKRYLDILEKEPVGDSARSVLGEQVRFGKEGDARRAAEQILQQEDKLGFRDAFDKYLELLIEAGAEIEIPLPHNCPHCGEGLYATAGVAEMFKKHAASLLEQQQADRN